VGGNLPNFKERKKLQKETGGDMTADRGARETKPKKKKENKDPTTKKIGKTKN